MFACSLKNTVACITDQGPMRTDIIASRGPTKNSGCALWELTVHSSHSLTVKSNTSFQGKLISLASSMILLTVSFGVVVSGL